MDGWISRVFGGLASPSPSLYQQQRNIVQTTGWEQAKQASQDWRDRFADTRFWPAPLQQVTASQYAFRENWQWNPTPAIPRCSWCNSEKEEGVKNCVNCGGPR